MSSMVSQKKRADAWKTPKISFHTLVEEIFKSFYSKTVFDSLEAQSFSFLVSVGIYFTIYGAMKIA